MNMGKVFWKDFIFIYAADTHRLYAWLCGKKLYCLPVPFPCNTLNELVLLLCRELVDPDTGIRNRKIDPSIDDSDLLRCDVENTDQAISFPCCFLYLFCCRLLCFLLE